jgi:hypothetical protein
VKNVVRQAHQRENHCSTGSPTRKSVKNPKIFEKTGFYLTISTFHSAKTGNRFANSTIPFAKAGNRSAKTTFPSAKTGFRSAKTSISTT